jgi:hypothetical protein
MTVNEYESQLPAEPGTDSPPVADVVAGVIPADPQPGGPHPVDPARSAAGRLGGKRVHTLALLGREYEREHGLKAGRQRQKQLIQLGKRYEVEHGLRVAKPRRRRRGDAWQEFLTALARVVKPAHRAAVDQLAAALRPAAIPEKAA